MPDRSRRARHRMKLPPKHEALTLLGVVHLAMGLALTVRPPEPGDPALAVLHTLLPNWVRLTLWLGAGIGVIACALLAIRHPAVTRWGWSLAVLMPAERAASYTWSALMWVIPGWPPGALPSLGTALLWAALARLVWLLGRSMPTPQEPA